MSGIAKSNTQSDASSCALCPTCNQPINTKDLISLSTPSVSSSSKRQNQSTTSGQSSQSKRAKTLRGNTSSDGKFKREWDSRANYPVWVRVYTGNGKERKWEQGIVDHCEDIGTKGDYRIVVHIQDDNDEWTIIPRTINIHNQDPIPSKTDNPNYQLNKYIIGRDDTMDGLPANIIQQIRCIKYHSQGITNTSDVLEGDHIGKILLSDDLESPLAIRNIICSLMDDSNVTNIIKIATGKEECMTEHALAYLIGQLCGIEISDTTSSRKDIDPKDVLDQIGSTNHSVECPLSQIFMLSAMSARTKKAKAFDPSGSLYDNRSKEMFNDPEKLRVRRDRVSTALGAIHASQTEIPPIDGPSLSLLTHGIRLLIDMRGTSDRILDRLADEGISRPANVLRDWIQKLANVIDPLTVRSPPLSEDEVNIVAITGDNADFKLHERVVSVVPVASILLGTESKEDTHHFNENYMKGLKLSNVKPEDLAATKEDDKVAQDIIDIQNILALLTAATEYDKLSACSESRVSGSTTRPNIDSNVSFTWRSEVREGIVKATSPTEATIEFTDGGSLTTKQIPLNDIEPSTPALQDTSNTGDKEKKKRTPEMFGGDRHRFTPSTTCVMGVLSGLSSKHSDTSIRLIQEAKNCYGEEEFNKAVHVFVADQEFMPNMISQLFSKLARGNEVLPILPTLAIGHAMKGLSVSMMAYYQCFFDPMLETMGVKVGSPEYRKLYKGTMIRKTNNLVANFTEMLAVSAAHRYLSEVGKDPRIKVEAELTSPIAIINAHIINNGRGDPTARSVVAMDPNMRPVSLILTQSLILIAKDFEKWTKHKWGSTSSADVGPSGYERKSSHEPQLDTEQQELSASIIEDTDNYQRYQDMKYSDDGDTKGLLSLCTDAGLLGNGARKDKETLAKKWYLCDFKKDKEKAIKFGPARKVPAGTNSTGIMICDLLFSAERYVIVHGHLLQRIRPKDFKPTRNGERYPTDWLVFFKALAVSTFMRYQPNYQRLTLSFLIQLTMIMKHDDKRCTDLALKRIRWTFCVSETGDSHNCQPVDLLQEHSLVERVKKVGKRDPAAYYNLFSRCFVDSYFRLQEIESRVNESKLGLIIPDKASRVAEQRHISTSIATVWFAIIDAVKPVSLDATAVELDTIQGISRKESFVEHADRSRSFYRRIDAIDHVLLAGSAFLKGYMHGVDVDMPPRKFPILRQADRVKKKKQTNSKSILASATKKSQLDAVQSLTEENGYVSVPSSSSMLDGLAKAGDGKSAITPAILSTISDNKLFGVSGDQIGDDPHKPVVLTRTKADASCCVRERAQRDGGLAPIHIYVDAAKDLYCHVPCRNGGNTVIQLARDIICESVEKYHFDGVDMICLTMDVLQYMTSLRLIAHIKRGKTDDIEISYGKISKVKKGSDDLSQYGARSDLLKCGDRNFIELLFNTICNQARQLENYDWNLHRRFSPFALAVVGGSGQACVVVGVGGKQHIRLNTQSIMIPCRKVEDELTKNQVVKVEEGEMMIYSAMHTVFKIGFTHTNSNDGIDCIVKLHSNDSDAFAGLSMQAIYYLESTCILKEKNFFGAIYLHGSQKSVAQIAKLGSIFKTNVEIDRLLCPTGRGFEFMLDLVAVYYLLEQDSSLPKLPPGHRAICMTTVVYTLLNQDYLRVASYGLTYSKLIKAMKSSSYINEVSKYEPEDISPINMTRQAVFTGNLNNINQNGLNLRGILYLLHHAFINRPATKKILGSQYSQEAISNQLPYNTVRAAAILAGEIQPLPDPVALLAHISCANVIFRRWCVQVYKSIICTDDEISSTCYTESVAKGEKKISVTYDLCDMANKYRPSWVDDTLLRNLRISCYGQLLPADIEQEILMPFDPLAEVKVALRNEGHYPTVRVSQDLLPTPATATSLTSNNVPGAVDDMEEVDVQPDDDVDEERSVISVLSDVNESDIE